MEDQKMTLKKVFPLGLMLFSFFFGAGNLIFPPVLGQMAGDNLLAATLGFCFSGVGLPVLGVLALAVNHYVHSDEPGLPAGKWFARVVVILCALSIGPFFAIPRTCATSFSVGILPMLDASTEFWGLLVYSIFYFLLTIWMVMKPSRIVDMCGKLMAPLLLICLIILVVAVVVNPMGPIGEVTKDYATAPFVKGMFEGYNTMDALCSLLFGAAVIAAIEDEGITSAKEMTKSTIFAGLVAGVALTVIYAALSYVGAQSVSKLGMVANGGQLVQMITTSYFGSFGTVIVALIFFLACITTSVGLVTSISSYFQSISAGKLEYRKTAVAIVIFSTVVANFGLTNIIKYSIPMLVMLYPIIIVLIMLNIFPGVFKRNPYVFKASLWLTAIAAINDGLCCAGVKVFENCFSWLPYYSMGLGWVTPAFVGIVIGFVLMAVDRK